MDKRIIPKTGLLALLPFPRHTAQAIAGKILVPKDFYDQYCAKTISPQRASVIEHELMHLKRQQEVGFFSWLVKYIFSARFRYQEELLAIEAQIITLIKQSESVPIKLYARNVSSWLYGNMVSYNQALNDLTKLYRKHNQRHEAKTVLQ